MELYRPIVQHVHRRKDLASLARTNKFIQIEAEKQLYRHIEIWEKSLEDNYEAYQRLLKLIASNPRIASYVHSFSYEPSSPFVFISIGQALHATTNLKRLLVYENTLGTPVLTPTMGVKSFKLEFVRFSTMEPMSKYLLEKLKQQSEVKEFEWFHDATFMSDGGQLDAPFPKLRVLSLWGPVGARATLQQQRITSLSLDKQVKNFKGKDVFGSVRSLRIYRAFAVQHAMWFPNLKYLWTTVC